MVEEREVQEHGGARRIREGLGHERCEQPLGRRLLLDDQARRHDVVSAAHSLGEAQLNDVLGRTAAVEGVLHGDGHLLERERGLAAQVVGHVARRKVKVAGGVERHGIHIIVKVEVLDLGTHVEDVALAIRALEDALEASARVAGERLARRRADVAEHTRHAALRGAPRQKLERLGIGEGEHVRLLEASKAVNRRAIEANALFERLFKLLRRDRKRLQRAQHVCEPQAHKANVTLLNGAQNEINVLLGAHGSPPDGTGAGTAQSYLRSHNRISCLFPPSHRREL